MKHDKIKARGELEKSIGEKLDPAESAEYFYSDLEIVTPTLDRYEDVEEHQTHMPEVDDIMPEAMYNYIGADIMLYHGDTVAQGRVRRRKRDVEENTTVRVNSNPILDTRVYEVKFKDGSTIPYSTNVIA